nr:hypothetical protein 16 [bacterium]
MGFLFMKKISFLVDGFNMYHSVSESNIRHKWLDLDSLCRSMVYLYGSDVKLHKVFYFTSFAKHRLGQDKNVVSRHKDYIKALESKDVEVSYGYYTKGRMQEVYIPGIKVSVGGVNCHISKYHNFNISTNNFENILISASLTKQDKNFSLQGKLIYPKHEEKETDVAIATKMFELLVQKKSDIIVIVSADTDYVPAIETAQKLFTDKEISFLAPARKNRDFKTRNKAINKQIRRLKVKQYAKHQFPKAVCLGDGSRVHRPSSW